MATFTVFKGLKGIKTGLKAIIAARRVGDGIDKFQGYFTIGKKILSLFGFGGKSPEEEILEKLDQMHKDMMAGFEAIHDHLDEFQLSSSLIEAVTELNFYYSEIYSICNAYPDGPERDHQLRQLVMKSETISIIEDPIIKNMFTIKSILLGEAPWSISDPSKSFGEIVADKEVKLAGDERYVYMSGAVTYYSTMLEALYNGLFVINFTEAFINQDKASDTPSITIDRVLNEQINPCEDQSPIPAYKPYFEMKIFGTRPPNDTSNSNWLLFTSGECLIYDIVNHAVTTGPYRLGTADPPSDLFRGFNSIPSKYHYPDSVYDHRAKSGANKYDEHYFFFKGNDYIDYLWDTAAVIKEDATPSDFMGDNGVVVSMQYPGSKKESHRVYLVSNVSNGNMKTCKPPRTWYSDPNSKCEGSMYRIKKIVEGGGGYPDGRDKLCVFAGDDSEILREINDDWRSVQKQKVYELLPALAGESSPWHIEEMMNREIED